MFQYKNTLNNDNNEQIQYNYYTTKLYKNQYEKTLENGGYIKIPFVNANSISNPNFIYTPTQSKYTTKNIYIIKKAHSFPGDYDGELIIEHSPVTNSDSPIYTCILLKTKEGVDEETVIDKIMNQSFDPYLELRLNDFVQFNKTCLVNRYTNVFVFPSPILIRHSFANMNNIAPMLFSKYEQSNYTMISIKKIQNELSDNVLSDNNVAIDNVNDISEGFLGETITEGLQNPKKRRRREKARAAARVAEIAKINAAVAFATGNTKNEISPSYKTNDIMDCVPVNMHDKPLETIEMTPVSGSAASYKGEASYLSTVINFFVFIIIFGVSALGVPSFYEYAFVKNFMGRPNWESNLLKMTIYFIFLCMFFTLTITVFGIKSKSILMPAIGVFLTIFVIISSIIIMLIKKQDPTKYGGFIFNDISESNATKNLLTITNMFTNDLTKSEFWKLYGIFMVIYGGITLPIKFTKGFNKDKKKNDKLFYFLLSLFGFFGFFFILLGYTISKN